MELCKKIKVARLAKGLRQEDLSNKSGVPLNTLKKYESQPNKNPTFKTLKKLADALDVDISFFVSQSSPNRLPIVSQSQNMVESLKKDVSQLDNVPYMSLNHKKTSSALNMSTNTPNLKKDNDKIYISSLSSKVGAGESVEIEGIEIYDTDILIPFSKLLFKTTPKIENLRCLQVDGYSMIPMLYPDSWVIAEISPEFKGDGLYIINFNGSFMVKLVQISPNKELEIISANKDYKSYTINQEDANLEIQIVGKVLRCII
ncbi:LexA family transcriptional regulator [Helicobacter sp. 13S00477-4]|uniref:XRE family transcriptional regulator n=1 Tax=Helicobacter sp. 13S00477-4 TaxID=1905759 RepID=UPI000BA66174|nr:LexA family transcriptional regulator [Helicobacter sp. 13S00477-4]PAF51306.1 hypothetical protein BKH44_06270 [Helicobacter sp. 13S00477-4]